MNDIERKLEHIREQVAKGQYLNALACSNELQALLLQGLNTALKREPGLVASKSDGIPCSYCHYYASDAVDLRRHQRYHGIDR